MADQEHSDGPELSPEEVSRLLKETAALPPDAGGSIAEVCRALGIDDSAPLAHERGEGGDGASGRPSPSADRYEEERPISRGAMGEVFSVRDPDLQRRVARKVLRREGALSREALERFLLEARITGRLEHPNIVPVHELGLDAEGNPYFTMKEVAGQSLAELISRRATDQSELLRIFLKVCDAVAFAHSRGVIHRDLKPANVMVGEFGEVLVMDWGLAKVQGGPEPPRDSTPLPDLHDSLRTVAGAVVGTPAYMSPEQARGELDRGGQANDVWALGAILYEILTGATPVRGSSSREVLDRLRRGEILYPLERFSDRDISRELDAVVRKAMALRPEDRYESVPSLARDVRAFLEGRLVGAADYGLLAPLGKWLRRNPALASVLLLALLLLTAMGSGFLWSLDTQRRRALRAEEAALRARSLEANQRRRAEEALAWSLYDQARAYEEASRLGEAAAVLDELEGGEAVDAVPEIALRVARLSLAARGWGGERAVWRHDAAITAGASLAYGGSVLLGDAEGHLALRRAGTGESLARTAAHAGEVLVLAVDPSARVALSAGADDRLRAWRLPDLRPLGEAEDRGRFLAAAVAPGGREAVASTDRELLRLRLDLDGGPATRQRIETADGSVTAAVFSPDGDRLVLGRGSQPDSRVEILSWPSGRILRSWRAHGNVIRAIGFAPAAGLLLTGSEDKTLALWSARTGRRIHLLEGHEYGIKSADLAPGAGRAVSGSFDRTVRLWDLESGRCERIRSGHGGSVTWVGFLDGSRWLSAGRDATLRLWGDPPVTRRRTELREGISSLRFSPDGRFLALSSQTSGSNQQSRLLRVTNRAELSPREVAWSGGLPAWTEAGIAVVDGGSLRLLDEGGRELAGIPGEDLPGEVQVLDARALDRRIAVFCLRDAAERPLLARWDLDEGALELEPLGESAIIGCTIVETPGLVVTAGGDGVRAVGIRDGAPLWTAALHGVEYPILAESPTEGRLLIGSRDSGLLLVVNAADGRILRRWEGLARSVLAAAAIPGGRIAVVGDAAHDVRFIDLERTTELRALPGHEADVQAIAVSRDGRLVASGDRDGVVRLWKLGPD